MGTESTPATESGFAMEDLQIPDSLFDDEQPADSGKSKADEGSKDGDNPPAQEGDVEPGDTAEDNAKAKDGQEDPGDKDGEEAASIEVDGETYTAERIKELKEGSLRWQDYTKKTQELADARKASDAQRAQLEPFLQWIGKIKDDKSLVDDIREALDEDQKAAFDAALALDVKKFRHPDSQALDTMRAEYEELKGRQELDQAARDLVTNFGITRDQADAVLQGAIDYHEQKKIYRTPEDQLKVMIADGLIQLPKKGDPEPAKKPVPKAPKVPQKSHGAKGMPPAARGGFDTIPISVFQKAIEAD